MCSEVGRLWTTGVYGVDRRFMYGWGRKILTASGCQRRHVMSSISVRLGERDVCRSWRDRRQLVFNHVVGCPVSIEKAVQPREDECCRYSLSLRRTRPTGQGSSVCQRVYQLTILAESSSIAISHVKHSSVRSKIRIRAKTHHGTSILK